MQWPVEREHKSVQAIGIYSSRKMGTAVKDGSRAKYGDRTRPKKTADYKKSYQLTHDARMKSNPGQSILQRVAARWQYACCRMIKQWYTDSATRKLLILSVSYQETCLVFILRARVIRERRHGAFPNRPELQEGQHTENDTAGRKQNIVLQRKKT